MHTRRHPRTLTEAFGPYCDSVVHPMPEPALIPRWARVVRALINRWSPL